MARAHACPQQCHLCLYIGCHFSRFSPQKSRSSPSPDHEEKPQSFSGIGAIHKDLKTFRHEVQPLSRKFALASAYAAPDASLAILPEILRA